MIQFISRNMLNLRKIKFWSFNQNNLDDLSLLQRATINLGELYCHKFAAARLFRLQNVTQITLNSFHRESFERRFIEVA